jgi:hypothetical protein
MSQLRLAEETLAGNPPRGVPGLLLWPVWLAALAAWTVALLTTYPVRVNEAVFSPAVGFSVAKLLHLSVYTALAVSGLCLPCRAGWRWLPVAILSLHAIGTEFVQQFVDRSGCWEDVCLNHAGILLGVGLFALGARALARSPF